MSFKEVSPQQNFPKLEEEILSFWQENQIFKKSLEKNPREKRFGFYEGPPTANGRPGIHHVLARSFKDLIPRFKTMQGYYVSRRAGWDTHGLPVEIEVEKQLGISGKKQIEDYGVDKFNEKCRESVWTYKQEWEKLTARIAYWVDLENPYVTYDNDYVEKVWGVLKQIWDKGLMYSGFKVVPYCPRCGTTLSSHEVAQGYKTVEDQSAYVKFLLKDNGSKNKTYFLVWTTTPWTLPGNIALAINDKFKYVEILIGEEHLILAQSRLAVIKEEHEIIREIDGQDLVNLEYEPLYEASKFVKIQKDKDYRVWSADFVSDSDGSGIVHIAPAFGADDKNMQNDYDFSVPITVGPDGKMLSEIGHGKFVKDADQDVKNDLKERNLLYKEEKFKHEYPFCWRCDSHLIYYARQSWFIEMSKLREKLLVNNENINWVPSYIKKGRFGEWLAGINDWALSRERYWGTPLPIWECSSKNGGCGHVHVVGSVEELKELSVEKISSELDLHKPHVDQIKIKCPKCGRDASRVSEVLDVWFDSGAMPFASGESPENYPADFISEAIDQTRGWFYTLLAISTLLDKGICYKNVICLSHVLDEHGKKMSKSKGNVINPWEVIDSFGADSVRWFFYTVNNPGEPKRMSKRDIEQTLRKFILLWWNVYSFFITYANIDKWEPGEYKQKTNVLDRWIESKTNKLVEFVTKKLEEYDVTASARAIEEFTNDLSTWYLRRSRKRLDKEDFYSTLYEVLFTLTKVTAPFVPFTSEEIYQNLRKEVDPVSVHLADWPERQKIDQELLDQMDFVKNIIEIGHAIRAEKGIKVRQPLVKAFASKENFNGTNMDWASEIICEELNVEEFSWQIADDSFTSKTKGDLTVSLDTEITPDLEKKGLLREILRSVQDLRKKAGLQPGDKVTLFVETNEAVLLEIITENTDKIKANTNLLDVVNSKQEVDFGLDLNINNKTLWLGVKK